MKLKRVHSQNHFLASLNLFLFIILLVVRDIRFVSIIRDQESEFREIALFCSNFPACFRVVPSWLGYFVEAVLSRLISLLSINPDPFSSSPLTLDDRLSMTLVLSGFLFRLLCFFVVWICLKQIFDSDFLAHVVLAFFQVILIAPQAKILGYLATLFNQNDRIVDWVTRSNVVYFVYFDYLALALTLLITVKFTKICTFSQIRLFLVGVILFLSFDYLPIFLSLLFFFENGRQALTKIFTLLAPGTFMIFINMVSGEGKSNLLTTFFHYTENNLRQLAAVPILIALVLVPPLLFGLIFQWTQTSNIDNQVFKSLAPIQRLFGKAILSLALVHLISLFTSNFVGEFARQSLTLQLLVLIYMGSKSRKRYNNRFPNLN